MNMDIPISRQCELMGLPRSSFYYRPEADQHGENGKLMRVIDEEFTEHPFYGYRRMTVAINKRGYEVNHKRISRLMKQMGIEAIYPKRKLSLGNDEHTKYPYLLRGVNITRVNQVWSTDITYIRLRTGFVYLVAVIDWYSRYVLSWEISTTLDTDFCLVALEWALKIGKPEIFNTDQGSQFTSNAFTSKLKEAGIKISMDGRGRAFDNIFIERLWRSVKYEEVYIHDYESVQEARDGLRKYFIFYNETRPHQSLGYETPGKIYWCLDHEKSAVSG
jgi:putative transposase